MSTATFSNPTLSERQWKLAHAVAQQLVLDEADANELGKAMAYLRAVSDREDAGERFFKYLETLATQGQRIGHSKRTKGYFASMEDVCKQYLQGDVRDSQALLAIVGWAFRLMRYYEKGVPPSELSQAYNQIVNELETYTSDYQRERLNSILDEELQEGQILEVEVVAKKSNKKVQYKYNEVTYTEREPRKYDVIPDGGTVKVVIKSFKEDGSINHMKFVSE